MKAIILAGGEGSRLRPLSIARPKPMLPLLGVPLLEHLIRLLKRHGFTELCMTLGYLPEPIRTWFGDGSDWGVSIEYRVESLPMGTAGSVGACRDFLSGDEARHISNVLRMKAGDEAQQHILFQPHRLGGDEEIFQTQV